jgi:hypothetical protein
MGMGRIGASITHPHLNPPLEREESRVNSEAMRHKPHEYWRSENGLPTGKQGEALRPINYLYVRAPSENQRYSAQRIK